MSRWWLLGLRSQLDLHLLLCMGSSPETGSLDRCSHIGDGWVVCTNRCSVFHIFYRLCSRYVIRKLRIYIFLYTRSTLWDYRYWIIQKCYQLLCVCDLYKDDTLISLLLLYSQSSLLPIQEKTPHMLAGMEPTRRTWSSMAASWEVSPAQSPSSATSALNLLPAPILVVADNITLTGNYCLIITMGT